MTSFSHLVGHEGAKRLLAGQIQRGTLASAYLFVGLSGIGKKQLALEFAKALQCPSTGSGQALGVEACGRCDSCGRVSKGSHPDLLLVAPDPENHSVGIDQVRALAHSLNLTPHSGRWKIGIVEEADALTDQAAHACLRILEEPPQRSILILIATAPHRLPATVVSRCHLVRLRPQGIGRVARFLTEERGVAAEKARALAAFSGGRLGLALCFIEPKRFESKNAALNEFLSALGQGALEIPLASAGRPQVEEALEWLAAWWRDLLVLSLKGDPAWLIHQDRLEELKQSPRDDVELLLDRIERTYAVCQAVQRNASPRIALAALLSESVTRSS